MVSWKGEKVSSIIFLIAWNIMLIVERINWNLKKCTVLRSVLNIMLSVLYCTVLYCTVHYFTVLYCTVMYCTVLYCTILYITVLYCTLCTWRNGHVCTVKRFKSYISEEMKLKNRKKRQGCILQKSENFYTPPPPLKKKIQIKKIYVYKNGLKQQKSSIKIPPKNKYLR